MIGPHGDPFIGPPELVGVDVRRVNVTELLPLPRRLALVRCPGCGCEYEDLEAAITDDTPSRCCGRLVDPVYVATANGKWVRA